MLEKFEDSIKLFFAINFINRPSPLPLWCTMDKFEQMVQMWQKKTPEEQKKGLEMEKGKCICPNCPTYTTCAKNAKELLFCATGKSFMCIVEDKDRKSVV
jgi:hypothetical protein